MQRLEGLAAEQRTVAQGCAGTSRRVLIGASSSASAASVRRRASGPAGLRARSRSASAAAPPHRAGIERLAAEDRGGLQQARLMRLRSSCVAASVNVTTRICRGDKRRQPGLAGRCARHQPHRQQRHGPGLAAARRWPRSAAALQRQGQRVQLRQVGAHAASAEFSRSPWPLARCAQRREQRLADQRANGPSVCASRGRPGAPNVGYGAAKGVPGLAVVAFVLIGASTLRRVASLPRSLPQ